MEEEKGKTGFRNGNLFCFNCGRSYTIPYPQPLTMASAMMDQFAKDHEDCPPTWKEPVNELEGKSEIENANWWAENGEHGMSSKAMFNHFAKSLNIRRLKNDSDNFHPCDPDDFSRCYKLLQAVPQWKARLSELKTLSPVWSKLIDHWDDLTMMYEQNVKEQWKNAKKIGMYELMETIGC